MDKAPPQKKGKRLSVNFIHAVFCLSDFLTFEDGDDGCPEMSVMNYQSLLHNIP